MADGLNDAYMDLDRFFAERRLTGEVSDLVRYNISSQIQAVRIAVAEHAQQVHSDTSYWPNNSFGFAQKLHVGKAGKTPRVASRVDH